MPSSEHGCAFVAKLNATGTGLIWSLCLANATGDRIAVDSTGAAYVLTSSVNVSAVTRLSPDGDKIVYSKPLGAFATALAVDTAGNAYAVGATFQNFVTTPGAFQTKPAPGTCYGGSGINVPAPCSDAFVIKLRIDGSVAYATYLGGSGADQARAAAVDSQGNLWITGDTESPDFPTTRGALDHRFHGEIDLGPLHFGDAFCDGQAGFHGECPALFHVPRRIGSRCGLRHRRRQQRRSIRRWRHPVSGLSGHRWSISASLRRPEQSVARSGGRCICRQIHRGGGVSLFDISRWPPE